MSRRSMIAVGLVVLVALAGCGQILGSNAGSPTATATSTSTPAPTPTATPTATPTPESTPTATPTDTASGTPTATPGSTEGDLPSNLMDVHASALKNSSYVATRYEFTQRKTNRSNQWINRKVVIRSDLEEKRVFGNLSQTRVINGNSSKSEVFLYGTANKTYKKTLRPSGNATYRVANASQSYLSLHTNTGTAGLDSIVRDGVFENVSTVQRDGQTFTRYELRTLRSIQGQNVTLRKLSGHLLRDSAGVVHEASLTATLYYPSRNLTITVDRRYTLDLRDDLTVEPPTWLETAEKRSG